MRWMALIVALWTGTAHGAPVVVADIPPVHSLVSSVMSGLGEPVLLLDGAASPHGGSLRPSQARALAKADLTVWTGAALTPWLDEAIRGEALTLLDMQETRILPLREGGAVHDDHGHGHGHGHGSGDDPHAWLDPSNGRAWLEAIAKSLSRIDPDNAARYAANAAAATANLDAARTRIAERLAPHAGGRFAVAHDAFHYFEERFGLETAAILSAGDGDRPGPRRAREVRARLAEGGIACLLAEPGDRTADRLAEEAGIRVVRLDPLGARLETGTGLYVALLKDVADGFADCLTPR